MEGTLYVVATPIGNLGDITERAAATLREVSVILAEDTRVSSKLLKHLEIENKRVITFNHYTVRDERKVGEVARILAAGEDIAMITDAGTPGVSDPGNELIDYLYDYFDSSSSKFLESSKSGVAGISHPEEPYIRITPVPGPSAVSAAISVCGFDMSRYIFTGFLPKKKRDKLINALIESGLPFVYFDSPYRVQKNLKYLTEKLGEDRRVFVGRELTKLHETISRGTIRDVLLKLNNEPIKGEFVIIVEKADT